MSYSKSLDELTKPDWMTDEQWEMTLKNVASNDVIRQDAKLHVERYLATGGKEGYMREGAPAPCLLLTTIGRKSGNHVIVALNFMQDGETYIVVGSLAGNATDPVWALNLKNNPQAWVQVKDQKSEASVEQITGEERDRLFLAFCKIMPLYSVFQQRTDRTFPLFRITPKK